MTFRAAACSLLLFSGVVTAAATRPATRPASRPASRAATGPASAVADTMPARGAEPGAEPPAEPVAEGWVVERVANLNVTPKVVAPGPGVDLAGALLFAGHSLDTGTELWRSDGTPRGTVLLKDISPGPAGSIPSDLTVFNGRVYFIAGDGAGGPNLWASDGTPAGTVRFAKLGGAPPVTPGTRTPGILTVHGKSLYFPAGGKAPGLWKTDGTEA